MAERNDDGLEARRRVVLAHEPPFSLGDLKVEPATRQLVRGSRHETIEPRVMQVLVALARAQEAIVTRDELIERCWNGRIVSEDAIFRALSRIRQFAADIGGGDFKVETIARVGYRLRPARSAPYAHQWELRQPAVCVLPFANMSEDPKQEYFSDGISEDITTDLSKVSALDVTARNTAFQFKGPAVDVRDVARRLGVTHVLEGSVRKAGNCIRVSAQLIDGATGAHVWAERYDRDLTDIFAIQDQISSAVVDALKLKLLPEERVAIEQRGTDSVEAYDFYLLARRYWIGGDFGDRRREQTVIRLCARAVELDPAYARAWALMALAQANLVYAYTGNEAADNGLTASARALALDPAIAEALLPNAWHLAVCGRSDESNVELAKALELEPDSWEVNKEAARLFYRQRRIEDAARHLERAITVAQGDFHGRGMLAACYTALGDAAGVKRCAEQLVVQVQDVLARDPDNGAALAFGAMSLAALGDEDRARHWRERALLLDADNLYMRYNLAWPILTMAKDQEAAIELLQPVLAKAGPNLIRLAASDPNLDCLRSDDRFSSSLASAISRVGIAPNPGKPSAKRR